MCSSVHVHRKKKTATSSAKKIKQSSIVFLMILMWYYEQGRQLCITCRVVNDSENGPDNFIWVWSQFEISVYCFKRNFLWMKLTKCCPQHFKQLYTIHGFKNGHYIPLVVCYHQNQRLATRNCFPYLTKDARDLIS